MWRFLPIAVLAGAASLAQAEGTRVRLGGVSVSGGYYGGPGWYGPGYWGPGYWGSAYWGASMWRPWGPMWWDPMWYGGWAHPGFWNGFVQGPGMGEVKLAATRDATVYLDGAYAGPARKLKSMWLGPGAYALEVRDDGGRTWQKKIYVLSGKTLELKPELKGESK